MSLVEELECTSCKEKVKESNLVICTQCTPREILGEKDGKFYIVDPEKILQHLICVPEIMFNERDHYGHRQARYIDLKIGHLSSRLDSEAHAKLSDFTDADGWKKLSDRCVRQRLAIEQLLRSVFKQAPQNMEMSKIEKWTKEITLILEACKEQNEMVVLQMGKHIERMENYNTEMEALVSS